MIATITLNPAIDRHYIIDSLKPGALSHPQRFIQAPAGKGINVARSIQVLGGEAKCFTLLGGPTGRLFLKDARRCGLKIKYVPIKEDTRENMVIYETPTSLTTQLNHDGPKVAPGQAAKLVRMVLGGNGRRPEACVLSGSLPPGLGPDTYRSMITRLQREKIRCVLDAKGPALKAGILAKPFCVKPNEYELQAISKSKLKSRRDFLRAADQMIEEGVRHVIVTFGKKGAMFVTEKDGAFFGSVPRIKKNYSVGAGDTLLGAYIYGLCEGKSVKDSAFSSMAASAASLENWGTGLYGRDRLKYYMKRVSVQKIRN